MATKYIVNSSSGQTINGDLIVETITLNNGSKLRVGTGDNGGNGGIARECVVGYEDKWENGVQYYKQISGSIIHAVSINSLVPDSTFDDSKGYTVGSTYFLANTGDTYKCTDSNTNSSIWKNINSTTPKYKVYTALLTQLGDNNNILTTDNGVLTIGITYQIINFQTGDDFTNVGAVTNDNGTYFVATGTSPAQWGNISTLQYDTSAPVVKILENTIGVLPWFYQGRGNYYAQTNEFNGDNNLINKSFVFFGSQNNDNANNSGFIKYVFETGDRLNLTVYNDENPSTLSDGVLFNTPIEFRIYN